MLEKTMHFSVESSEFLTRLSSPGTGGVGIFQFLGAAALAYVGGLLASLTPCVYPMIPITIGVIGGSGPDRAVRRSWSEVLMKSGSYIFGMAVVYSFLGVLAGVTGRVFGTFTNTAAWYISLALIINLAALIMLDLVPFDPLSWWQTLKYKAGFRATSAVQKQGDVGLAGAFVLGASSGLIAAPCTTPVLTGILAYIAKTQSVGIGMALMFSFSLGLGTLLLAVAIFTGALQILPRSGGWMKKVKMASGLILLAFAEYLIYRAGSVR